MRPTFEARLGLAGLVAVQLTTSIAGVLLLDRMSPAVERILTDNVYSTETVEEMLAALVTPNGDARFHAALSRARRNITEPEEGELIEVLDRVGSPALSGDTAARADAARALRRLGAVNRESIAAEDLAAQRLGLAGAWAMALLGFAGFLVNIGTFRRLTRRLLLPVVEIDAVLAAARSGDAYRRCAGSTGSVAGGRAMANLNWLLDRQPGCRDEVPEDARLRDMLTLLLDQRTDRPVVMADISGDIVGTNLVAVELFDAHLTPRSIVDAAQREDLPPGWAAQRLQDCAWWIEGPEVATHRESLGDDDDADGEAENHDELQSPHPP